MSACNVGDLGSIPGSGRSPGEGNGNPLQYYCLENPMDGGAWWVHGVAKSQLHFHFQETKIPGDAVKKKKKMQRKVNAYSRVSEYSQSKLILFPSTHIWFEVLNFFLDSSCKNVPSIPYCDCVILSLNCFTLATTREEFLICLSSYWTVWLHYTYGVQKTGIN